MFFPNIIAVANPKIKNGPKGTALFIFFLPKIIKEIPIIAPEKNEINHITSDNTGPKYKAKIADR